MNRFAKFVKEKRKELNLNQEQLAEKAGVGLRFVRELEQGKSTLRLDKVNQLLKLFDKEAGVVDWHDPSQPEPDDFFFPFDF